MIEAQMFHRPVVGMGEGDDLPGLCGGNSQHGIFISKVIR